MRHAACANHGPCVPAYAQLHHWCKHFLAHFLAHFWLACRADPQARHRQSMHEQKGHAASCLLFRRAPPPRALAPPCPAVYTVKVCRHPSCTCPDFNKGHLCKHVLFVMMRVLKQPVTNPLIWQVRSDSIDRWIGSRIGGLPARFLHRMPFCMLHCLPAVGCGLRVAAQVGRRLWGLCRSVSACRAYEYVGTSAGSGCAARWQL